MHTITIAYGISGSSGISEIIQHVLAIPDHVRGFPPSWELFGENPNSPHRSPPEGNFGAHRGAIYAQKGPRGHVIEFVLTQMNTLIRAMPCTSAALERGTSAPVLFILCARARSIYKACCGCSCLAAARLQIHIKGRHAVYKRRACRPHHSIQCTDPPARALIRLCSRLKSLARLVNPL